MALKKNCGDCLLNCVYLPIILLHLLCSLTLFLLFIFLYWLGHLNLSTWYLGRWFLCCFLVVWNWIVWCCYQQGLCSSVRTKGTLLVLRGVTKPGLLPCFLVWNRIVWPVSARTVFNRGPLAEGYSDSPSTLGVSWLFVNLATRKLGSWLIPNP